jgi:hypothetical protein
MNSLHLQRHVEPPPTTDAELLVNLRTCEHYRLLMGEDATIDPDL